MTSRVITSGPDAGRFINAKPLNLNPLEGSAVTVDGYSAVVELGDARVARLKLDVTAVSTDDTLDVNVETSSDGITWYTSGSFTQATGVTSEQKLFMLDRFVRAHYNVGGSDVSIAATLVGEVV